MPSISTFQQTRALSSPALAKSTLNVLHDYDKLMHCQPLIGQIEPLTTPSNRAPPEEKGPDCTWFKQTEYVPFLPFGIWKQKVVFENWFRNLSDTTGAGEGGVETKVYAPMLTIDAVFRVERRKRDVGRETITERSENEGKNEAWVLVEETKMECSNVFVKWLSIGQHRKAQKTMLDNILHEAEKRAYVGPEV